MNRRKAIRLKCLECSGYEYNEVKNCGHKDDCSLYPYRFGRGQQNPKLRDKAIRAFCMWCCVDQILEISMCGSGDCPLFEFRGYNRTVKKSLFIEKPSPRGFRRYDLPVLIPGSHQERKHLTKAPISNRKMNN